MTPQEQYQQGQSYYNTNLIGSYGPLVNPLAPAPQEQGAMPTPVQSDGPKITYYGYSDDPTPDSNSARGIGDRDNHLVDGLSVALTQSERQARFGVTGKSTGQTFQVNGHTFRDDDTAPEGDRRIDVYAPGINDHIANQLSSASSRSAKMYAGPGDTKSNLGVNSTNPFEQFNAPGYTPPSWNDISSTPEYQNASPQDKGKVADKWYSDTFNYAGSLGGFTDESRQKLYDYYSGIHEQAIRPPPAPDLGKAVQDFSKQIASTASGDIARANKGVYDAELSQWENDAQLKADIQSVQANPSYNDEQKQENIQALIDAHNQQKPMLQKWSDQEQKNADNADQAKTPGYDKTLFGQAADTIGHLAASLPATTLGATLGPAGVALTGGLYQGNLAYDYTKDSVGKWLDANAPKMDPATRTAVINKAADQVSQIAQMEGMALGTTGFKIPVDGLVKRVMLGTALTGMMNALVGGGGQLAQNKALQHTLPGMVPSEDQGVISAAIQQGLLGGTLHLLGSVPELASGRTPAETPATQPIKVAEPQQQEAAAETAPAPTVKPKFALGDPQSEAYQAIGQGDSLRQSILANANRLDPDTQRLVNMIPEDARVFVHDPDRPIVIGGDEYTASGNNGLYFQGGKMAFIPDNTPNVLQSLLHEGMHAAYDAMPRDEQNQVNGAYQSALRNAGRYADLPARIQYALSSPEEFFAHYITDDQFAKWAGPRISGSVPIESSQVPERVFALNSGTGQGVQTINPHNKLIYNLRDYIAQFPHAEDLVKAIDQKNITQGEAQAQTAQFSRLYSNLKKSNPGLSTEVDQIGRGNIPFSSASPEAQQLLAAAKNLYSNTTGQQKLPLVLRPDVESILKGKMEENGHLTPDANKLFNEGRQQIDPNTGKPYFKTEQDLLDLQKKISPQGDVTSLNQIRRGQVPAYPHFMYTYTPEAMIDAFTRHGKEAAIAQAFGRGDFDLFNRTKDALNRTDLSEVTKQKAINAVDQLKRYLYGQQQQPAALRVGRSAASAMMAGSVRTGMHIFNSSLFILPAFRGMARTALALSRYPFDFARMHQFMEDNGLAMNNRINLYDDTYTTPDATSKATNFFSKVLNIAGLHSWFQNVARSITADISRSWIDSAERRLAADPQLQTAQARMDAQTIKNRGIDPSLFTSGNATEKDKLNFVREDVRDLQTEYRPEDYPAWMTDVRTGYMGQFLHYAMHQSHLIMSDVITPMARAWKQGDYSLASNYAARLIVLGAAGIGSAEVRDQIDKLFGKSNALPAWNDIFTAFAKNDPEGAHMLLTRIWKDALNSQVWGVSKDVAGWAEGLYKTMTGKQSIDQIMAFNPTRPAVLGLLDIVGRPLVELGQQHRLSEKQVYQLAGSLSAGVRDLYNIGVTVGAPVPNLKEAQGTREEEWARSKLESFYSLYPDFDPGRDSGFRGTPKTPWYQDIRSRIYANDMPAALQKINEAEQSLGTNDKAFRKSLLASLRMTAPLGPNNEGLKAFKDWAPKHMNAADAASVLRIQNQYLANMRTLK